MAWKPVARIQNRKLSLVLKRRSIIAELVQEDAECPDVGLFVEGLLSVDVDHFGTSILKGGVFLNILVHQPTLDNGSGRRPWRRSRAEITKHEATTSGARGDEDIFNLDVAVQQRGLQIVHAGDALSNVGKDAKDLGLRQAVLQASVHKVDEAATVAKLHEQEDLVAATAQLRGVRVHVGNYGTVALEALHGLDFGAHASQALLVGDSDALEDSEVGPLDGGGELDEVDVGEAALGEILLNHDAVAANLNLGAGSERACGSAAAARAVAMAGRDSSSSSAARMGGIALLGGMALGHLMAVGSHDAHAGEQMRCECLFPGTLTVFRPTVETCEVGRVRDRGSWEEGRWLVQADTIIGTGGRIG